MGTCKDQLTPKTEKGKSLFGAFKSKKKASASTEDFSDLIARCDGLLTKMITVKESDLKSEKGSELENARKLAKLEQMAYHLNQIIEIGAEYGE